MHHVADKEGWNGCLPICLGIGCHGASSRFTLWLIPETRRGSKEIYVLPIAMRHVNPIRY